MIILEQEKEELNSINEILFQGGKAFHQREEILDVEDMVSMRLKLSEKVKVMRIKKSKAKEKDGKKDKDSRKE
jgi:hypothetical protein